MRDFEIAALWRRVIGEFESCRPQVVGWLLRQREHDIDDILSEAQVKVFQALKMTEIVHDRSHSPLIWKCVRQVVSDIRRRRLRVQTENDFSHFEGTMTIRKDNMSKALFGGLRRLSPPQANLIQRKYLQGVTVKQLAGEANVAPGTMSRRIQSALSQLRAILSEPVNARRN